MKQMQEPCEALFTFRNTAPPARNANPLSDKQNQLNQVSVPLTEYSNKFLRTAKTTRPVEAAPFSKQRKIIVFKEKFRNLQKENTIGYQNLATITLKQSAFLSTAPKRFKKVKTEEHFPAQYDTVNQSSLLSSLQLKPPKINSCLIANLINGKPTPKHNRTERYQQQTEERISQSRGLERFSKLYVRNKCEMLERNKKRICNQSSSLKFKDNNFEVRKITPLEKTKKRTYLTQKSQLQHQKLKNLFCLDQDLSSDFQQLNGWETLI